ncbi:cupin domain-containing protein [Nonomuraea sp. NPDC049400]|uniref:cupin domain-containing protein n=1 Tax=Nonomuraea sp. NPDC049400 TaxID=3364352 RepID=UPI003787690B
MTGDSLRPYLLAAGQGEPAATPQLTPMTIKASGERTDGMIGMLESVDPPGFSTVLHTHAVAELWYILDGHYDYHVAGRWLSAQAGAVVFVPPGCPHGLRAGPSGGRKLTIFVPGGAEGLFRDIHRRAEVGDFTQESLRELDATYGVTALGPLPPQSG